MKHKKITLFISLFLLSFHLSANQINVRGRTNAQAHPELLDDHGYTLYNLEADQLTLEGVAKNLFPKNLQVDVKGLGNPGTLNEVRIRGGNPSHTLTLVDSMRLGDASSPQFTQNMSHLEVSPWSGVEVYAGAHSTLYGSDALSGSVNLIPRTFIKRPYALLGGGSFGSSKVEVAGGRDFRRGRLAFVLGEFKQNNFNLSGSPSVDEEDPYKRQNIYTSYIFKGPSPWKIVYLGQWSRLDLDGNSGEEDLNSTEQNQQNFFMVSNYRMLKGGRQKLSLKAAYNKVRRDNENKDDTALLTGLVPDSEISTNSWDNTFIGDTKQFKMSWDYFLFGKNQWTWGLDFFQQGAENDTEFNGSTSELDYKSRDQVALFLKGKAYVNKYGYFWGLRQEFYDTFDENNPDKVQALNKKVVTYSLRPFYKFNSAHSVSVGLGTGFKLPSIYESLDPFYGNTELKPEKSLSTDISYKVDAKALKAKVSLFQNKFKDLITSNPSDNFRAYNISKALTEGLEVEAAKDFGRLEIGMGWQFLKAIDEDTQDELIDRPKQKGLAHLKYRWRPQWDVSWKGELLGERKGYTFSGPVDMPSVVLHNLGTQYRWSRRVHLNLSVTNVFDKEYQRVPGYATPGVGAFAYVQVKP